MFLKGFCNASEHKWTWAWTQQYSTTRWSSLTRSSSAVTGPCGGPRSCSSTCTHAFSHRTAAVSAAEGICTSPHIWKHEDQNKPKQLFIPSAQRQKANAFKITLCLHAERIVCFVEQQQASSFYTGGIQIHTHCSPFVRKASSKSSKSLVNTARWEIIDMELKIHNIFEGEAVKGLLKIACSDLCLYTFEVIYLDHIGRCTAGNRSAQLSQYWVFCSGLLGHISLLPPCYHISQCIFRSSENQLLQKTKPSQGTSFQLIFIFNGIIFKVNV